MLQRDRQIRTQVHQLADAGLFVVSFWLAYVLRDNRLLSTWLGLDTIGSDMFLQIRTLYFLPVLAAPLVLESQGFYNRPQNGSRWAMLWPLFKSCLLVTLGLVLVVFMLREITPRGVPVFFGVISFGLVWTKEELIHLMQHSRLAKEQYKCRVILAGSSSELTRLRKMVQDDSLEIVAEFNLTESSKSRLIELIHAHSASGVLLSARHVQLDRVESVIQLCELEGVEVWLTVDLFATKIAHASFDEMSGHPLIVFRSAPETSWQMLAKLLLDFMGSLLLIAFGALPMAVIALLIKLTSPGPVMFRQPRSGLNGKPFTIYKFRTMVTNAEQFKHELAAMNEMSGPVFKVTNDPRVTPVGKWLRKFSLDELPQLFNVLRGEMSLVGPRPLPVDEVKRFDDLAHRRRLSVKPGLTCLWQISGRNQISDFKEWVRLDLEYIDHWSLWLDLKILLRTIPAVLIGTGAK
jgi:exopolysaccharide biosynthesis polyprenyl glycosylphosphotransferase